jgi:hypothetical protein
MEISLKLLAYAPHYYGYHHNAGGETSLHSLLTTVNAVAPEIETSVLLSQEISGVTSYTVDGVGVRVPRDRREAKNLPFQMFPEYDIIITQLGASQRAGILGRQLGIPTMCYVHNDYAMTMMGAVHCDLTLFNTDWVKRRWNSHERKYDPPVPPGIVVHPIINPDLYRTTRGDNITIINLSDGSDKQHSKGSEVFYAVADSFRDESFLGVKGAYGHQDMRQHPNVSYRDHSSDIKKAYQSTKVILAPSRYESYGRVALEAAASGIPNICSDLPGIREALGPAGNYCDPYDIDEWEMSLRGLLKDDYYEEASNRALLRSAEVYQQSLQ